MSRYKQQIGRKSNTEDRLLQDNSQSFDVERARQLRAAAAMTQFGNFPRPGGYSVPEWDSPGRLPSIGVDQTLPMGRETMNRLLGADMEGSRRVELGNIMLPPTGCLSLGNSHNELLLSNNETNISQDYVNHVSSSLASYGPTIISTTQNPHNNERGLQRIRQDALIRRQSEWVHALRCEVAKRSLARQQTSFLSVDDVKRKQRHGIDGVLSAGNVQYPPEPLHSVLHSADGDGRSTFKYPETPSVKNEKLANDTQKPKAKKLKPGEGMRFGLPSDKIVLSHYQHLIRETIEIFETSEQDVIAGMPVSGRQKSVQPGQVGLRCRYCAHRAAHWRGRGAVYYPGSLSGVYQAAQNMATNHFLSSCDDMPADVRENFQEARRKQEKEARRGGGKSYWIRTCQEMGMEERRDKHGVWFRRED